jgi:hypothetical protein
LDRLSNEKLSVFMDISDFKGNQRFIRWKEIEMILLGMNILQTHP